MDNFFLSALLTEIRPKVLDKTLTKISLADASLLLDFRLPESLILRASFDASSPALFLAAQKRENTNDAHPFISTLRKALADGKLIHIAKSPLDRIVLLEFEKFGVSGEKTLTTLVLSLTGRSANAYLLDANGYVEATLNNRGRVRLNDQFEYDKTSFEPKQFLKDLPESTTQFEIIERFFKSRNLFSPLLEKEFVARCQHSTPLVAFTSLIADLTQQTPRPLVYSLLPLEEIGNRTSNAKTDLLLSHFPLTQVQGNILREYQYPSLSEAASLYYQARTRALLFQDKLNSLKRLLTDEIKKRAGLIAALESDKAKFEDPERFKQMGDLLLANPTTARIKGTKATVIDYYDTAQAEIEIELGEGKTLQQAAAAYFTQYQKARRALEAIATREASIKPNLEKLRALLKGFEEDLTANQLDEIKSRFELILGLKKKSSSTISSAKKGINKKPTGRWYLSPTGFEIVVGKNDKDNDTITFRLAGSQDIWMHAADYPGSHVIIRNPNRKEVPPKVIQEAAEIAAFYSQAKQQDKVSVHYTQKKFVTKPPRSKPGLVRLSSFKTILVAPRCVLERIEH
jgi:predicted ribosome quality control (RQC) complex YloA/Tae2 family protein